MPYVSDVKPIYIVTGDGPRCGSSAMMKALEAGGMAVAREDAADAEMMNNAIGNYVPNPTGRYELLDATVSVKGFPDPGAYAGKVIKMFPWPWSPFGEWCIPRVEPTMTLDLPYRCIWLHREAKERWASVWRAHRVDPMTWMVSGQPRENEVFRDAAASLIYKTLNPYWPIVDVKFADLLARPLREFRRIARAGWPIDPTAASKVIGK